MIIVKASVTLEWITPDAEAVIERAGRTCYKSEDRITPDSAGKFITKIIANGHHSVLEHASARLRFVCDRGVSHELVRHRLASFSQESTRYCDYGKAGEIQVIEPPGWNSQASREQWREAMEQADYAYQHLRSLGVPPQIARSVLPTCLKTEIVTTANLREWRHIFALRCAPAAHPQICSLMTVARDLLRERAPHVFPEGAPR